ncbi:hypothetical protein AAMO2058_001737700 [Amorphochlora amoebiformis]
MTSGCVQAKGYPRARRKVSWGCHSLPLALTGVLILVLTAGQDRAMLLDASGPVLRQENPVALGIPGGDTQRSKLSQDTAARVQDAIEAAKAAAKAAAQRVKSAVTPPSVTQGFSQRGDSPPWEGELGGRDLTKDEKFGGGDNGGYPDKGGYSGGKGGYSGEGGGYSREGGGYSREGGGYSREGGGYSKGEGGYSREGGGYSKGEGGYSREGGGYSKEGGGYSREGGGYSREGGGYSREGGYQRREGYSRSFRDRGTGRKFESSTMGEKLRDIDYSRESLPTLNKMTYKEHPSVANMSPQQRQSLLEEYDIVVRSSSGHDYPNPITDFRHTGFPEYIIRRFEKMGFTQPTPIQMQAWPLAMTGTDVLGLAATGSGKTLAFAIPSIMHINANPLSEGDQGKPQVVVVAPTRELAQQIEKDYFDIGCSRPDRDSREGHRVVCLTGGSMRGRQISLLGKGLEIIVATPGRLIDCVESGAVSLDRVSYVVLDEADRMLDMGFEPQILKVLGQIRPDRQILFFSATWPRDIQNLARKILRSPVRIQIGDTNLKPSLTVKQTVQFIADAEKNRRLMHILKGIQPHVRVLIFVDQKRTAEDLRSFLEYSDMHASTMHGDKSQREREEVLRQFRSGRMCILIASDVAARGLDVKGIRVVINYDMPLTMESYVHRIGRTGRAGEKGLAISFCTHSFRFSSELIDLMTECKQHVPESLILFNRGGFRETLITPDLETDWTSIPSDPPAKSRPPSNRGYQSIGGSYFNPRGSGPQQDRGDNQRGYRRGSYFAGRNFNSKGGSGGYGTGSQGYQEGYNSYNANGGYRSQARQEGADPYNYEYGD